MKRNIIIFLLLITGKLFAQMPSTITKEDKVYGLSKFWQEVNYNFVYLDKVDRDQWEDEYRRLITDVQETENDYAYYRLLQQFCAFLSDGHTNIFFPENVRNKISTSHFGDYRLFLKNIDGEAIVTRVNLSKKEEIPIGTEIVKVNGLATSEYINRFVKPYISSSTKHILEDWGISRLFRAPNGTSFDFEMKLPNGEMKQLKLSHTETFEKEVYPKFEDRKLLDFKWLKHKTAYVSLNSFDDPKIDTLFTDILPELYKAKKLIIDLRFNGGGSSTTAKTILEYLTNDKFLHGARSSTRNHIATFKAWGSLLTPLDTIAGKKAWEISKEEAIKYYKFARGMGMHNFEYFLDTVKLKAKRIIIPTVILIGHSTASAAEDFLIYADNQPHMTKIGEPTFGSTGQPMMFELPGGGMARICTKKDTYPDGKEFIGYGIQPDIEVKKSLRDYLENKDPALEKAIEYLDEQ